MPAEHPVGVAPDRGWDAALDAAIAGELDVVFQPVVDLARGVVCGYEALARFAPVPGLGPDAWFAEAHRRDLGADLDAAVVRRALEHRSSLPPNCFLAVNLEPTSVGHDGLRRVLTAAGGLGGLVLEVTEHRPIDSYDELARQLEPFRAAGALIAVDDAGAGYAGLQQILRLRPSIVKVDRELVSGVHADEAKADLIEMLGRFACRIDAWILAEGVEEPQEALRLHRLGVPLAQGWFFARPAPPWGELSPSADTVLGELRRRRGADTLHPFVQVCPAGMPGDEGTVRSALTDPDGPSLVVLVDEHRYPVGAVTAGDLMDGAGIRPVLRANVATDPVSLAHRVANRTDGGWDEPVAVTDDRGRFLGVVAVPALLAEVARRASARAD